MEDDIFVRVDQAIKEKFSLFNGKRKKEEDEEIYNLVYDTLLDKIIAFLAEELTLYGRTRFLADIKQLQQEAEAKQWSQDRRLKELTNIFKAHLARIPDFQQKLENYLLGFLNYLQFQSLKVAAGRQKHG